MSSNNSKKQSLSELSELRQRIAEPEKPETKSRPADGALLKSGEQVRIIADCTFEWENWVGSDGKVIWINAGVQHLTGYSIEECMAMDDFPLPLVHEADRGRMAKLFEGAAQGSDGNDVEFRISCKDGSLKWTSVSWEPVYDDDGISLGHRSSLRDITERKQAEEMLKKSEENFHNIFNKAPIGIYQVTPEGCFISANPAAARILGYESPKELMNSITDIGAQVYAFTEDRNEALRLIREHGFLRNFEVRCRHKDGSIVWVSFNARLVCDEQGNILYHEGTSQDVSRRKLAEEQLNAANKRFADLLDSVDEVVYVADMETYEVLFINKYGANIYGDVTGKICWQTLRADQNGPCTFCTNSKLIDTDGNPVGVVSREILNTINKRWYDCRDRAIRWSDGRLVRMEIATDITDRKRTEEELLKHRDHLEELVRERTTELQQEIAERKKAETALKKNTEDLEVKSENLGELNTALKILLRQIEEDRKDLEERFASNVKDLILPYVEKMKKSRLDARQSSCLAIIEANLNEIVSPLLHTIRQFNLTPREIQVASLVKDGKTTKEIAGIIGVGSAAVDFYRKNIRKKLKLNSRKANLQSYLQTLK